MAETAVIEPPVVELPDGVPPSDEAAFVPEPGIETPEKLAALKSQAQTQAQKLDAQEKANYEKAVAMSRPLTPAVVSDTPAVPVAPPATPPVAATAAKTDATPVTPETTPEQRLLEVKYKEALRRDGFPQDEIDTMPMDRLVKFGKPAIKRQADTDKVFNENKKLKGAGNGPLADLAGDNTATQTARTNRAVVDGQVQSGDNAEMSIDQILGDVILDDQDRTKITNALNASRQQAQQSMAVLAMGRYESAAESLKTEFPGLSEETNLESIADIVRTLDPFNRAATTSQAETTELMKKACYVHFGPRLRQQAQTDLIEQHRKQLNGQPDLSGTTPPPPKTLTKDDRDRLTYDAVIRYPNDLLSQRKWLTDQGLR